MIDREFPNYIKLIKEGVAEYFMRRVWYKERDYKEIILLAVAHRYLDENLYINFLNNHEGLEVPNFPLSGSDLIGIVSNEIIGKTLSMLER